ncbi:NmrA family NAD(P)-binding protein [Spirosoma litoris]
MALFITGTTGYIGGTIAARLVAAGRDVRGLVRDEAKAKQLATLGITPVLGNLDDTDLLIQEAQGGKTHSLVFGRNNDQLRRSLNSNGVIPVLFLNNLLKDCGCSNPNS